MNCNTSCRCLSLELVRRYTAILLSNHTKRQQCSLWLYSWLIWGISMKSQWTTRYSFRITLLYLDWRIRTTSSISRAIITAAFAFGLPFFLFLSLSLFLFLSLCAVAQSTKLYLPRFWPSLLVTTVVHQVQKQQHVFINWRPTD